MELIGRRGGRGSDKAGARDGGPDDDQVVEYEDNSGQRKTIRLNARGYINWLKSTRGQVKVINTRSESKGSSDFATDPPVSEAQRKAMFAAKSGHSTLGIPQKVGAEFAKADPGGKLPE